MVLTLVRLSASEKKSSGEKLSSQSNPSKMSAANLAFASGRIVRYSAMGSPRHRPRSGKVRLARSEEHTYELKSLMRMSYAVFCLQTNKKRIQTLSRIQYTSTTNQNN